LDPYFDLESLVHGRVGTVVVGKYRLDRVLGIGGMAAVYAATHRNQAEFAVKMLHPDVSSREEIRSRFLREGYIANSVKHAGAVRVVDDDVAEDGAAFLVMELLDGISVEDLWFECERRIPLRAVIAIAHQLLDVLASAHAKSIVHRDIKPANLFVTRLGDVKVLDFGIARLRDSSGAQPATQAGAMLGTPAFMAPEQAKGQTKDVDGRTDLWAVGATMFSLISGKLVHEAESATMLLLRAGTTSARSLRSVDEEVPAPIVRVVDKALAFDKPARWADAATMRDALKEACIEALGEPPSRDKLAEFVAALNAGAVRSTSAPPPPKLTDDDVPQRDSTLTTKVEGKGKPAAPDDPKPGRLAQTLPLAANVKVVPPPGAKASPSIEAAKEPPAPSPVRTLPMAQKSVLPREPKQDVGLTTSKPVSKEVPAVPAKEAERAPLAPVVPSSPPAPGTRSYVPLAVGIVLVVGILVGLAVVMLDRQGGGGQASPPPPASSLPAAAPSASAP
jgi:serine/threonine protein kinase